MTVSNGPADAGRAVREHHPHPVDGRRPAGELRPPGDADGAGPDRLPALHAGHAATTRRTRTGPAATASCSRAATPRCCSTASCTSRATTSRSTRSSASARSTRRARATPSTATCPASRPPPARSARASPPPSAWRSASACWPPASTRATTPRSTRTPTSSPPTATSRRASPARPSSLAGHLGLGRLIGFYDDNHISIEGDTKLAFSEDVGARYEAYGWHVQNLGEDIGARPPRGRRRPPPRRSPTARA